MTRWMTLVALLIVLGACSSRSVGVGAGGDESDGGDGETGIPTTAGSESTESGTDGPGDDSTTTSSGGGSTGGDVKFDLAGVPDAQPPPPGVFPCKAAHEGTSISGDPPLGAFSGTEAWFAGDHQYIRLVIFDDSADTEAEGLFAGMYNGALDEGPAVVIEMDTSQMLPITEAIAIQHFVAGNEEYFMGEVTLDEYFFDDFNAPHEVHGSITLWPDQNAAGVTGSFSAGYCENYERFIWGE